jgi:hypothetical protein
MTHDICRLISEVVHIHFEAHKLNCVEKNVIKFDRQFTTKRRGYVST